ncbi:unnamed protein product [Moneuplotes crassus]|uniref:Uncharacterized protein n=1 Tax=Euplotes crassus TaxID=5936 RepID=A0AAD1U5K3_EUPCR|nr:unnamed protein product [Moneuplotes crassus]
MEKIPVEEDKEEIFPENFEIIEERGEIQNTDNLEYNSDKLFTILEKGEGIKVCKAIQLKNYPYIGIYSFNYEWMPTLSFFNSSGIEDWNGIIPQKAGHALRKLREDHKFRIERMNYVCVNYSSTMFRERFVNNYSQKYARFNLVFHPYFMDYLKPGVHEDKKYIMASIYTNDEMVYGLKKSNFFPIQINSEDLYAAENWVELHVHRAADDDPNAIAVSPNNAGVLIDLSCPLIPFYSMAIELDEERKSMNVLITYHCIIDETCLPNKCLIETLDFYKFCEKVDKDKLMKPRKPTLGIIPKGNQQKYEKVRNQLLSSFACTNLTTSEEIQHYIIKKAKIAAKLMKTMMCQDFDDIKDYIQFWVWDVFTNDVKTEEPDYNDFIKERENKGEFKAKFLIIDEFIEDFYKFIWSRFGAPVIPNYGERYIKECGSVDYMIHLFLGFAKFIGNLYYKLGTTQLIMAQDYMNSAADSQCQLDIIENKNLLEITTEVDTQASEKPENPYEKTITEHLNSLLSNPEDIQEWGQTLMQMPEVLQDLLFSRIWILHSKIDGIHPDFGRVSYINSPEISEYYWTNQEQRAFEIMGLSSIITSGDSDM